MIASVGGEFFEAIFAFVFRNTGKVVFHDLDWPAILILCGVLIGVSFLLNRKKQKSTDDSNDRS